MHSSEPWETLAFVPRSFHMTLFKHLTTTQHQKHNPLLLMLLKLWGGGVSLNKFSATPAQYLHGFDRLCQD